MVYYKVFMHGGKKVNVLMVVTWCTKQGNDTLEAGVFHYEQALNLIENGCNVAIYFPYDQQIGDEFTKKQEWGVLTYRSKFIPGKKLYNFRTTNASMAKIMEDFKPDVIHAHCAAGAGALSVRFAKKYKLPLVITEHSPLALSRADKYGLSRVLSKRAFKNSNANICVSEFSKKELQNAFPKACFGTIYNGIIMPKPQKKDKKYYKEGYVNAVIVAMLYDKEVKGMPYLLEALQRSKEEGKKIILHHIGGGDYLDYFEDMAKKLGLEKECIFYGKCDRDTLYEIEEEMDFFVSSSLNECSGVSVEEAMLLGKPILGTNSGGVDSLVPEHAGLIVERANAVALKDGMVKMIEQMHEFDNKEIQKYAMEHFEINGISKKYMELYKNLINR